MGIRFFAAFLSMFCLFIAQAQATSIRQLTFDEVIAKSQLVFEGRVVDIQAQTNAAETAIVTTVTFQVLDVIKGNFTQSELHLNFAGGSANGLTMVIGSMQYPRLGEQGIYFVGDLSNRSLNPLIGWSQGHFLLGGDAVLNHQGNAVTGIVAPPAIRALGVSKGTAAGLQLKTETNKPALNVGEFKKIIKERL